MRVVPDVEDENPFAWDRESLLVNRVYRGDWRAEILRSRPYVSKRLVRNIMCYYLTACSSVSLFSSSW